jgi:parallel beta-helix repeat protein
MSIHGPATDTQPGIEELAANVPRITRQPAPRPSARPHDRSLRLAAVATRILALVAILLATLTAGSSLSAQIPAAPTGVRVLAIAPLESLSYLSDRAWSSMSNGWGPAELDRSNGDVPAGDGRTLTLNGASYAKGLGVHAPSDIRYALNGACSVLTAVVGVDDEVPYGTVVFQVLADGVKRFDSGVMSGASPSRNVTVDIGGVKELALIVSNGGDDSSYDHGDWANAQISCTDNSAPSVDAVSPAPGATGIPVNANITATFSESMNPATLTTSTARLVPQGSSTPVPATVTYDRPTRIMALDPAANLAANTTYAATIKGSSGGAADLAGNPLPADRVWTFTTSATAAGTPIYPGEDIQARVNAAPAGTAFLLKAGVHRMQTISPKIGDSFIGEPSAILSGARLLTMTRSGNYYVATGQTQQGTVHGYCASGYPRCSYPEELFVDDQRLLHVDSLGALGPGRWYFDYNADTIYMSDDPSGRRVETSVTTTAFLPTANNVTISNLIVEKYANLAQYGPINAENTSGWVLSGNEVRLNHGGGIRIGHTARVLNNNVHHNGQIGVGGIGDDVLVEGNNIAYNNAAHFDCVWECGGTKFVATKNLVVRKNFIHHNDGPGLWTDIDNINVLLEENQVEDNGWMGIVHEISYAAVIRNNTVRRNGFAFPDWAWGAGILIAASPNVEVYGNTLDNNADAITAVQQNRGTGSYGKYEVSNLWVHDNIITNPQGWTGIVQDIGDNSCFTSRNNRFDRNVYHIPDGGYAFVWMNGVQNEAGWKAYGQDVNGTFGR